MSSSYYIDFVGKMSYIRQRHFLIGTEISEISGEKLPTLRQMLQNLLFNRNSVNIFLRESAEKTVKQAEVFLQKFNVQAKKTMNSVVKLEKEYKTWIALTKSQNSNSISQKEKRKQFVQRLENTFDMIQTENTNYSCDKSVQCQLLMSSETDINTHIKKTRASKTKANNKIKELREKRAHLDEQFTEEQGNNKKNASKYACVLCNYSIYIKYTSIFVYDSKFIQ